MDADVNATPAEINMAREGLNGMGDFRPVRERSILFAAVAGSARYVFVINNITEYIVGTCGWDDLEWDGGSRHTSLPAALRQAAERADKMIRFHRA